MRDVEIGAMVFLEEKMDDERSHEVRETFYRRTGDATYRRHGLVQGDPASSERPRFIVFSEEGYEYPMVGALPVKPLSASRFFQYLKTGTDGQTAGE